MFCWLDDNDDNNDDKGDSTYKKALSDSLPMDGMETLASAIKYVIKTPFSISNPVETVQKSIVRKSAKRQKRLERQ